MADKNRIAGLLEFQLNGKVYKVAGPVSYNLGKNKRNTVMGPDGIHGYAEVPQVSFVEVEGRVTPGIDIAALATAKNQTITLKLASTTYMWPDAWFAGEGTANTEEATMTWRFESTKEGVEI